MSLGVRLAATFAVLVALTAVLIGSASYFATDRQVKRQVDDFLDQRVQELSSGVRQEPGPGEGRGRGRGGNDRNADDDGIVAVVEDIRRSADPDSHVQFLDKNGEVTSLSGLPLPVGDDDLRLAESRDKAVLRTVEIEGTQYRMITAHVDGGGAIQVVRSFEETLNIIDALRSRLFMAAGGLSIAAAGVGWFVAQRTTRPLRSLTAAVDTVAETGNFAIPVAVEARRDEVGRLAAGFQRMLGSLHVSREQQHRLVQDAAHELRSPLTSVTANVEWLVHARELDDETRTETLQGIRGELRELNDVINEIVELATDTYELPEFVEVDLAAVAGQAADRFQARTTRVVELHAVPSLVAGDPDSLNRAITNLLSNADKYSPAGTPVTLDVGAGRVAVGDEGPGIPAEERDLVFERFYRRIDDRSKPGSGLGLAIVSRIVHAHQGEIFLGDSPAGGALVGFHLPEVDGPAPS